MSNLIVMNTMPKPLYSEVGGNVYLDVIAEIRTHYPNPRDIILIETNLREIKSLRNTLKSSNIFIVDTEETGADSAHGAGSAVYILLDLDKIELRENDTDGDCILKWLNDIQQRYELIDFSILVKSDSREKIIWLRDLANDSAPFKQIKFIFPDSIRKDIKLFKDGVYLNRWSEQLTALKGYSRLNSRELDKVLKNLEDKITGNNPEGIAYRRLQSENGIQGKYISWLLVYETLTQDLSPVYLDAYLRAMDEYRLMYPMSKMSLFERINYVRSLPSEFGFVSSNGQLVSICKRRVRTNDEVVLPNVYEVFDFNTCQPVTDKSSNAYKDNIDWDTAALYDYKSLFSTQRFEKQSALDSTLSGMSSDAQKDIQLCEKFLRMSKYIPDGEMFPTIRNTVLAVVDDFVEGTPAIGGYGISTAKTRKRQVIIYAPELAGIHVNITSDALGSCDMLIDESLMHRLVDYKFAWSLQHRERASVETGLSEAGLIVQNNKRFLFPAVEPLEMIRAALCPADDNGLTYYQRGLRVEMPVVPIINDPTSEFFYHVFDPNVGLSVRNVMRDNIESQKFSLTCFGGLRSECNYINVTTNLWRSHDGRVKI